MRSPGESHFRSYPSWDDISPRLGGKLVDALAESVALTRRDLARYRGAFPLWVSDHSERGLASWIHDRMWTHVASLLDGTPNIFLRDKEPFREITDGVQYRIRMKRHSKEGEVRSFETAAYLDFLLQPPPQAALDGLEEINLIAGYVWLSDLRDIGEPLISLRDGKRVIWMNVLDEPGSDVGADGIPDRPVRPSPPPLVIETLSPTAPDAVSDEGE